MKHLITAVLALVAVGVVCVAWNRCGNRSGLPDNSDSVKCAEVLALESLKSSADMAADGDVSPIGKYYGDTLLQYDGYTMVMDYVHFDNPYLQTLNMGGIVTYRDTVPVDTCLVYGEGGYRAEGNRLKFAVGVDTVTLNLRQLPKSVDFNLLALPSGTKVRRYSHKFSLTQRSHDCGFLLESYLPDNSPAWLYRFVSEVISEQIGMMFEGKCASMRIRGKNTWRGMGKFYGGEFERLYRKEYSQEGEMAPCNEYSFMIAPAWEDRKRSLVTYRIYTTDYGGGVHGYMQEYYMTFDKKSGKTLNLEDLVRKGREKDVLALLDTVYTERRRALGYNVEVVESAGLGVGDLFAAPDKTLKEQYGSGSIYPVPALTGQGLVFSYQPYEAGAFSDGIIHILLPYSRLRGMLR